MMKGIDRAANGLEPLPIYNEQIMRAFELVRSIGWDVVPRERVKQIDIGGNIQRPPEDAEEKDKAAHYVGVFKGIGQAMVGELFNNNAMELHRSEIDGSPDYEHIMYRLLVIIPQGAAVANTVGGPRKVDQQYFLDRGMPPLMPEDKPKPVTAADVIDAMRPK